MANFILCMSTVILGSLHFVFLFLFPTCQSLLLKVYVIMGVTSSILNHGFTFNLFKWFDRSVMVTGVFADTYLILNIPHDDAGSTLAQWSLSAKQGAFFGLMGTAALSYLIAKSLIHLIENRQEIHDIKKNDYSQRIGTFSQRLISNIPHFLAHLLLTSTHCLLIVCYAT